MQQTTKSMGPGGWIWFLNRWSYLEHFHSINLYCYLCQIPVAQNYPIQSHWDCTFKDYSLHSPLHSGQSHSLGAAPETTEWTPRKTWPIYYLPHIQVAFLWHFTFSNTKSNISWRTKNNNKMFYYMNSSCYWHANPEASYVTSESLKSIQIQLLHSSLTEQNKQ